MQKPVLSIWNVPYEPLWTRCGSYMTLPLLRPPIYWTLNVAELSRVCTNSNDCLIDIVRAWLRGTDFVVVTWTSLWSVFVRNRGVGNVMCFLLRGFTIQGVPWKLKFYYTECPMKTAGLLYKVSHDNLKFPLRDIPWILKIYYIECPMNTKCLLYRVSHEYWSFTVQGVPLILKVYYAGCPIKLKVYYRVCPMNTEVLLYRVSHEYCRFTMQAFPWNRRFTIKVSHENWSFTLQGVPWKLHDVNFIVKCFCEKPWCW